VSAAVEKYLKGTGENQLILTQEGGELNGKKQLIGGRTPMEIGARYIFFLNNISGKYMAGGDPINSRW